MTEQADIPPIETPTPQTAAVDVQNDIEAATSTAAAQIATDTPGTSGAATATPEARAYTSAPGDQDMYADEADIPTASVKKYPKRTVALHTGYVGTGYFGED